MNRLLAGAALVVLSAGLGAGGSAAGRPTGRLLVVATHFRRYVNDHPADVLVVGADGRHLRKLTHDKAANGPAEWMPDGRRIIFESHPSTGRGARHIYVINSDGTGRHRLTSAAGGYSPDVSPDGRRIAFLIARPNWWDARKWGLYVMDASGRHQRFLVGSRGDVQASAPSWSPDGRMIMFVTSGTPDDSGLYVINGDGTGLTRLATKDTESLDSAKWSPRGRTLAIDHHHSLRAATSDYVTIADVRRRRGRLVLRRRRRISSRAMSLTKSYRRRCCAL